MQGFTIRLLQELDKTDTTYHSKDSLAVVFTSKTGHKLKTTELIYQSGCRVDSIVTHFNDRDLPEYREYWTQFCDPSSSNTTSGEENFCRRSNYTRWEYDSLGRVTKLVMHTSTPKTTRTLFTYRPAGASSHHSTRIDDFEFWD